MMPSSSRRTSAHNGYVTCHTPASAYPRGARPDRMVSWCQSGGGWIEQWCRCRVEYVDLLGLGRWPRSHGHARSRHVGLLTSSPTFQNSNSFLHLGNHIASTYLYLNTLSFLMIKLYCLERVTPDAVLAFKPCIRIMLISNGFFIETTILTKF